MKRKITVIIAAVLCCVLFLSGCDVLTLNSPENLVRPPKLSGDDGALQAAFEKAMAEKGEFILKYPSAGEYRSAYVRKDCDGDGADEAFVFYSLKAEEMSVYMFMLDYYDKEWHAVGDVVGEGNDVYSVEFCDLNSDGVAEVFVGWRSIDSKANKKLCVYYSDNYMNRMNYRMLAIEPYTSLYTVDLDFDGQKEIITALINATADSYTTVARLLKMTTDNGSQWQLTPVGQVNLYSGITSVLNMKSGLTGGRRYVYIDEAVGDSYLTEMIYWDNYQNTLLSAFVVDGVSIADCPTSRKLPLICSDVNKDGKLEIPHTTLLENSSIIRTDDESTIKSLQNENVYITSWLDYDEGRFTVADSYIENSEGGFRIAYDKASMSDWAVKFFPDEGISQFFITKPGAEPDSTPDASLIFTVSEMSFNEAVDEELVITRSSDRVYVYDITENGELGGIDAEYIRSIFSLVP